MRRIASAVIIALTLLALAPAPALAGPEWCDDGSPPPNDFRFRMTGAPSSGSSTSWLTSTTSGTLSLSTGVNTLVGGVATGMLKAIANAVPQR